MIGPRVNGNSGIRFGRKGDSRSRRDVLGKDEKKGKRGEGKGKERKGQGRQADRGQEARMQPFVSVRRPRVECEA